MTKPEAVGVWLRGLFAVGWFLWGLSVFPETSIAGDETKPAPVTDEATEKKAELPPKRREFFELLPPIPEEPDPETPPLHFSRVQLEGIAQDDRVTFQSDFEIQVREDGVWQDVPLRLLQAHVTGKKYTGPGEEGPATGANRDKGIVWKIRGKGEHHLHLEFWVPLTKTATGRQLQLSLPHMPNIFEAKATIFLPGEAWTIRSPKEVVWESTVEQARAERRAGNRSRSLELLAEAARTRRTDELRKDAIETITGEDLASGLRASYSSLREARWILRARYGSASIERSVAKLFSVAAIPEIAPRLAHRGDPVIARSGRDFQLGVMGLNGSIVVNSETNGLVSVPRSLAARAWNI